MDDGVKAKFRAFANRYLNDGPVLDTGLTGADLRDIADLLETTVEIQEIDLGDFARFGNLRPVG